MEPVPRVVRLYADAKGRCPFEVWLNGLRDLKARAIVRERIARLMLGNLGDAKAIGEGVFEMRVTFGPGYRIYYAEDGKENRRIALRWEQALTGEGHRSGKDLLERVREVDRSCLEVIGITKKA